MDLSGIIWSLIAQNGPPRTESQKELCLVYKPLRPCWRAHKLAQQGLWSDMSLILMRCISVCISRFSCTLVVFETQQNVQVSCHLFQSIWHALTRNGLAVKCLAKGYAKLCDSSRSPSLVPFWFCRTLIRKKQTATVFILLEMNMQVVCKEFTCHKRKKRGKRFSVACPTQIASFILICTYITFNMSTQLSHFLSSIFSMSPYLTVPYICDFLAIKPYPNGFISTPPNPNYTLKPMFSYILRQVLCQQIWNVSFEQDCFHRTAAPRGQWWWWEVVVSILRKLPQAEGKESLMSFFLSHKKKKSL